MISKKRENARDKGNEKLDECKSYTELKTFDNSRREIKRWVMERKSFDEWNSPIV